MWFTQNKKTADTDRVYLDYAAATPIRTEVLELLTKYQSSYFANASAIHTEGQLVHRCLTDARAQVAKALHVRPETVLFTGSGTESNNLAILGHIEARRQAGTAYTDMEVLSTAIEHPSVQNTLTWLQAQGVKVHMLPLDAEGRVQVHEVEAFLNERTCLCTVAYVNSELGTIQPVRQIARTIKSHNSNAQQSVYVHIDAAQAPLWVSCQLESLGADMMSLDAGKFCGPKGVGILIKKPQVALAPILHGGSQENGVRPATENVPAIAAAALALQLAQTEYIETASRVTQLRDELIQQLQTLPEVVINGSLEDRVANNVNISIPRYDSEYAVITLDAHGIACSTRSACAGADGSGSAVIRHIYNDDARANSTIRFTLGPNTSKEEIGKVKAVVKEYCQLQAPYQSVRTP